MKINLKEKSKTLVVVFCEEEAWGILPKKELQAFFQRDMQNLDIDDKLFNEIKAKIRLYAWNRLLDYLSYRERSSFECYNYLKELFLRKEIINNLIEKAKEMKYLSDKRFTELYIESLIEKRKSKPEIINKLRSKGIGTNLISEYLDDIYQKNEIEILKIMIEKADKKYYNIDKKKRKEKIISYLSRKGFNYYKIVNVIDSIQGEDDGFS